MEEKLQQQVLLPSTRVCDICGEVHDLDDMVTFDEVYTSADKSTWVAITCCARCAEEKIALSAVYRERYHVPTYIASAGVASIKAHTYYGIFLPKVERGMYGICEVCHRVMPRGSLNTVNDAFHGEQYEVCDTCLEDEYNGYESCVDCGEWFDPDDDSDHRRSHNGDYICGDCYDDNWFTCENCEEVFRYEDRNESSSGDYYCDSCYSDCDDCDDDEDSNELINPYSHKPKSEFHSTDEDEPGCSLFIGTETEWSHCDIDDRDSHADYVYYKYRVGPKEGAERHFYMKHDTSLKRGIEVVSHPMTLNYWHDIYSHMAERLKKSSQYSDDCNGDDDGTHVHLSRNGMTKEHEYCFGAFFELCQRPIKRVARRNNPGYAAFLDTEQVRSVFDRDPEERGQAMRDLLDNRWNSRYRAVNWCNNRTVEVRIFKQCSTALFHYSAIELCHAAYQFTKRTDMDTLLALHQYRVLWDAFINFMAEDERYYDLLEYLEDYINDMGCQHSMDTDWIAYHNRLPEFQSRVDNFCHSFTKGATEQSSDGKKLLDLDDFANDDLPTIEAASVMRSTCFNKYCGSDLAAIHYYNGERVWFFENRSYIGGHYSASYFVVTPDMVYEHKHNGPMPQARLVAQYDGDGNKRPCPVVYDNNGNTVVLTGDNATKYSMFQPYIDRLRCERNDYWSD